MNSSAPFDNFYNIFQFCRVNCTSIERWPSYFHRRYLEFLSYKSLFPQERFGKVLELGCGIGYQSAFLAQIADHVVATDLPDENIDSHAPGMLQAQKLHEILNISNVELLGCSAENLPFEENTFDMVYSSHVLEHIPDQMKALAEIYRVLKPGGFHFCVVPTRAEKMYAFLNYYTYLIQRSVVHALKTLKSMLFVDKVSIKVNEKGAKQEKQKSMLSSFPFPPPHGYSKHYLEELKNWSPSKWAQKIKGASGFEVICHVSTQINPLLSLLGPVMPEFTAKMHGLTRNIELRLGKFPFFRSIGINSVVVVKCIK